MRLLRRPASCRCHDIRDRRSPTMRTKKLSRRLLDVGPVVLGSGPLEVTMAVAAMLTTVPAIRTHSAPPCNSIDTTNTTGSGPAILGPHLSRNPESERRLPGATATATATQRTASIITTAPTPAGETRIHRRLRKVRPWSHSHRRPTAVPSVPFAAATAAVATRADPTDRAWAHPVPHRRTDI